MESLIYKLKKNNIKINVVDDQLKLEIPQGFDPTEILKEVRANKAELTAFIKKIKSGDKSFDEIDPAPKKEYYALSSVQKRLYFLYQMDNQSMAYNLPQAVLLEGNLDKEKLKESFNRLLQRHESLRTSLVLVDNEPMQKVLENVDFHIEKYTTTREKAPELVKGFARPFELAEGPLIRVGIVESEESANKELEQHILLVDMHHIIADGTSMSILIKEFMALYNDHQLPPMRLQYKDYAEWQQSDKRKQEAARQKDFWFNEFVEEVKPLHLPTDFKRPLMRSNAGAYYSFSINIFEVQGLKKIAEQEGATLFIVLLSLYKILLSKLSNQEDVVVGTPIAGRHHDDLENMIGMFVPSLPLRSYPKGNSTFKAYLDTLKTKIPACFDNQSYEYEELLEELKIERNISYNPLFDFMFSLQNFEKKNLNMPGLSIKSLSSGHIAALFDMTFVATLESENLAFGINYSTELFTEETIKRFAGNFKKVVSAVVTNREIRLADIDIIPHDEKAKILNEFNKVEVERPATNLVELFEKQVANTPLNIALVFLEETLTYQDLNKKANQLAHHITSNLGTRRGDHVGIYMDRSPAIVIAMMAIMKTGATYIVLDPEYPSDRISMLVDDAAIKLVLTDQRNELEMKAEAKMTDVLLDDQLISSMSDDNLRVNIENSSPAYIIYTSGSTGAPKGVIIEHASMLDYSLTFKEYFCISDKDKVIQQASYSFDTVVEEIFPSLISGGEVIIMPDGGRDVYALIDTINRTQATILSTTPIVLNMMNSKEGSIPSLRAIISGGDLLLPSHINHLIDNHIIYNTYGPSESTVCITFNKITDISDVSLIGKPIDNRHVLIMNQGSKLCPVGVPGELCVSGIGLAKGYLGDEKLTKEKFVDNPIILGKKMYRTGDMAKWLPDGRIEFLGRVDDQVKIRGIRIEIKEIESYLLNHELISEAVVITKGFEIDKHLVAYYVADKEIEVTQLRDFLKQSLPYHMIPAYFVHLHEIPLTANSSKLDKKTLPEPEIVALENHEEPQTDTERILLGVWAEVLKIDQVNISITHSFFELGGHSLKAALLINRLRKEFSIEVPLKEVFKNQSIKELAQYIEGKEKNAAIVISKALERDNYVLSAAQKRLYFLYEFDKQSLAYNLPQVVRVEGTLDVDQLNKSFLKLIQRHESLRTGFEIVNDQPVQIIHDVEEFEVSQFTSLEKEVPGIIRNFIRPFDLSQPPLIRVGLVHLGDKDHILMVDLNHIITDGMSQDILVRDFIDLYNGGQLSPLNLQYKDYSEWQQSDEQQTQIAGQKNYWLDTFKNISEPLDLPIDNDRESLSNRKGASFAFDLSLDKSAELKKLADREGATMFMTLLSVLNVLLGKLSHQEDVIVGTTVAGREHKDLEGMIGMFVNTLPLRNYPKTDITFRQFLNEVKHSTLASLDNQSYPYEALVDELKIPRNIRRNPLFDVMFGFQNMEQSEKSESQIKLKAYESGYEIAKFDLTLMAAQSSEKILLEFGYASGLFKSQTIKRFSLFFKEIVNHILRNPDIRIGDIDMLTQEEKSLILDRFSTQEASDPISETLVSLFEKQILNTPDNEALVYRDKSINYADLDRKTNKVLSLLRANNIGKGDVVGLMLEKSPELIACLIAILKAGAAYLPMNVEHPEQRNKAIIRDSGMTALLIDQNTQDYNTHVPTILISPSNIEEQNQEGLMSDVDIDDTAYIIYTSGSTGIPKGVAISHSSVVNLIMSQKEYFEIDQNERILQFSSITFDASVEQIWLALSSGATLILPNQEVLGDNASFENFIFNNKITHLHATPSFLDSIELNMPNNLIRVVAGGEPCKKQTALKYLNDYRFYNKYGTTETTVTSTIAEITDGQGIISIGKPIRNTSVYILDKQMKPAPLGTKGELYLGGAGLAKGYLNNPQLTTKVFIDHPFVEGEILYKTGDMARWKDNGDIECLGRIDNQVKVRGYRIELGEIENKLADHELIKDAVVIAIARGGEKMLVAYYVAPDALDVHEIKGYLQKKVPSYMIPVQFVHMEKMLVNSSGKVNRKMLPEPIQIEREYIAPTNETEESLVEILSSVIKMKKEEISITDNFFDLGGNSLSAMTVVNKIQKRFNVGFTLRELFSNPIVKVMADNIGARTWLNDDKLEENNSETKELLI